MKDQTKKAKEEMMEEKCCVCGKSISEVSSFMIINGSWILDLFIPKEYWGKGVCSEECYDKLVEWWKVRILICNLQNTIRWGGVD